MAACSVADSRALRTLCVVGWPVAVEAVKSADVTVSQIATRLFEASMACRDLRGSEESRSSVTVAVEVGMSLVGLELSFQNVGDFSQESAALSESHSALLGDCLRTTVAFGECHRLPVIRGELSRIGHE